MTFMVNPFVLFPVAAGGDPNFANVEALLHMDGADASTTFTDVTGRTWTAAGNAQIDTAQSKFGGASGLFDGSTDRITTPDDTSLRMGSSNFTFECWVRPASAGAGQFRGIYTKRTSNATFREFSLYIDNANRVQFLASTNGSSWGVIVASGGTVTHDVWLHIAAVRNGSSFKLYLSGVEVNSATNASALFAGTEGVAIGALGTNGDFSFNGHIDDVRLTKGVARYTANFTPPTAAFPDS